MLYLFESYALNTDLRELRRGNAVVAIQPQVFDLLELLVRHRDRVVTKDDMLAVVWKGRVVSESTLTSRINAARAALGDSGEEQRLIRTLPRKGLRFLGAVREEQKPSHQEGAAVVETVTPETAAARREGLPAAERRQLTVASCELLLGAAHVDPEDFRDVVQAYHDCLRNIALLHGGFAASAVGTAVLVYFGIPATHEDDAERAVHFGLDLVAAVAAPVSNVAMQARVGIATGLVLVRSEEVQGYDVVGETPNLAARLQAVAKPNTVVIAGGTRRLLGNLFELEEFGPAALEVAAEAKRAWAALRARSVESRFEALRGTGLTPLVGRGEESDLLLRRWSRAKIGEGQAALLSGEPGIGKSRLTAVLMESITGESHACLRYFCSPQRTNSALYPIIGQFQRAAGLMHDQSPETRLDKLDAMLAETSTSKQDAALFAEMLSLPNDGRYPALHLSAQQLRQKTLEALDARMAALARLKPVLMIFEDAHWADPTSLEALSRAVDCIRKLPVLLIVTFRPEFEPPWTGRPHVTALTINRLAERETNTLINRVLGDKLLPANIRRDIIERTDGIPLFVEEMTKAVLEADSEGEARRTAAAVPLPALSVPASLHASLMARLDRLGSAKELAQIGAAIGREFSHTLLAAVMRKPETELYSALDRLIQAGLLFRQGMPPYATYLFKHALVQDAAYSTLLREPRRALHARIVDALERQFSEITENQPELLARHCTEAGLIEKATRLWGIAGQRSLERSALAEAEMQLTRALALIATLPSTPAWRSLQILVQVGLANAQMHTKGHAAFETKASLEQARKLIENAQALGEPLEDPLAPFSVRFGFWVANYMAFDGDVLRDLAAQFLTLAEKECAPAPIMIGHRLVGISLLNTGDLSEGRTHLDRGLALYDPVVHRSLSSRFGQDIRVAILSWRALALWLLGYPEAARADADRAVRDAREIDHAATLMNTLAITALTHIHRGNYAAAKAQTEEVVALASEKGALFWNGLGMMFQGCVFALTGESSRAIESITLSLPTFRSTGATVFTPFFLSVLSWAHADLGQFDGARHFNCEAMRAVEVSKERWCEADIHRMAGEIALLSPERDTQSAQAHFERSLAIAKAQQAHSLELRAATSLGRLWCKEGKRTEARNLLGSVYCRFSEGFETADVRQAKAFLDEFAM